MENQPSPPVVFRTYRITDELRAAIHDRRKTQETTLRGFVAEAVQRELPAIVKALASELPNPSTGSTRPIRLPLSADLLATLATASEATGLPATRLLLSALVLASRRKRRGGKQRSGKPNVRKENENQV